MLGSSSSDPTYYANDDVDNSAAQPASPRRLHLRAATPLINEIFGTDDPTVAPLQELLEKVGQEFLFGRVANIVASSTGCYEVATTAPHITEKLEAFLQIIQEQRIRYLLSKPTLAEDAVFSSYDMRELHAKWKNDYKTWMDAATIRDYEWWCAGQRKGDHQRAHQILRSSFSAFLFQIIGNKHLLLTAIQHPICIAAQPADAIQRFMTAWEQEKSSDEYKRRVDISERLTEERRALKRAAHAARQDLVQGKKISMAINRGAREWDDMSSEEARLLNDFNSGKLHRVRDDCDAAFRWNAQMRATAGSAASRMGTL